jgi:hypothetical protein
MFLDRFDVLTLKIKKNIILIYFKQKNILKNNWYHISKHDLNGRIHGFISIF